MENQWAVRTRDLCKAYHGRSIVDHLNLHVPHGCVYGFLGPNGAGKSTSMKMMLGLALTLKHITEPTIIVRIAYAVC